LTPQEEKSRKRDRSKTQGNNVVSTGGDPERTIEVRAMRSALMGEMNGGREETNCKATKFTRLGERGTIAGLMQRTLEEGRSCWWDIKRELWGRDFIWYEIYRSKTSIKRKMLSKEVLEAYRGVGLVARKPGYRMGGWGGVFEKRGKETKKQKV